MPRGAGAQENPRGGPVSRILSGGANAPWMAIRLDARSPARLELPTRTSGPKRALRSGRPARGPYSALLPVGLAVRPPLPEARWALTPPFHPHPHELRADCSLWRFPSGFPARALPGTVASWSPDFPRPRGAAAIRPSALRRDRHARAAGQSPPRHGQRPASPAMSARSASVSGPRPQGRKRRRKASSTTLSASAAPSGGR